MKRALLLILAGLIAACGAARHGTGSGAAQMAEHELAFLGTDDLAAVKAALKEGSRIPGRKASADFLMADLLDSTGEPDQALDFYFKVIEAASQDGSAPFEAIAAAMGVVAIRDRAREFKGRFEQLLERLDRKPGKLPEEAWYQLMILDLGLSRRAGEYQRAEEAAVKAGCLRSWRVAGPFGPWTWRQMDAPEPPGHGSLWPASVDLGPGRGKRPVREVSSNVCSVNLGDQGLALNGATWASTTIALNEPKTVRFRLQTSDGALVLVQNREVFRRDPRRGWPPYTAWFQVKLPAGAVTISVMVASNAASPGFSLTAMDTGGRPAFESSGPVMLGTAGSLTDAPVTAPWAIDGEWEGSIYARLKAALWWEDIEAAWRLIDMIEKRVGEPSAIFLLSKSEAISLDQSIPGEVAYERARAMDSTALEREPKLWLARAHMADREIGEERYSEAIALLEAGSDICPGEPELLGRLLGVFAGQGWTSQARTVLEKLEALDPESCSARQWKLALARSDDDFAAAAKLARSVAGCDASSPALAEELSRAQEWRAALGERKRLSARDASSAKLAFDVYRAASAMGDEEESMSALGNAMALAPWDETMRLRLADTLLAGGDSEGARRILEEGAGLSLGFSPSLDRALAAVDGLPVFQELRIDGASVIERYKTENRDYDTAAVFVLDRAVYVIGEDGGSVMLVHSVTHLKTDEAVERYGDLNLPDGAILLTARTIKADGRALEPEDIAHKQDLSFPDLKPGDFVESEYAVYSYPSQIYPGGFDTERFYFENFETAFHRSEIIVILPDGMEIVADPRGLCPKPLEASLGGMRALTWKTGGVLPFPAEPYSPSATEYLPSIRITSSAGWDNALAKTRDLLADKERPSRVIDNALEEALSQARSDELKDAAAAIYRWVVNEIEPGNDLLEQASHIIARRSGNRARAYSALMRAAGLETRLAFVKPGGADDTASPIPDLDDWSGTALMVEGLGWVYMDADWAPFGYLPASFRNRPAVFLDDAELTKTDGGKTPRDSQKIHITIAVEGSGDAACAVSETLEGAPAVEWREVFQRSPRSEWKTKFQEAYLSSEMPGAELTDLKVENLDNSDRPLVLEYEASITSFARSSGASKRFEIPFAVSLIELVGGLPARATPLILSTWTEKEVSAEITLPGGSESAPPDNGGASVESKWGRASNWFDDGGNVVKAGYALTIEAGRIPPAEYQAFVEFARALDRVSKVEVSAFQEASELR